MEGSALPRPTKVPPGTRVPGVPGKLARNSDTVATKRLLFERASDSTNSNTNSTMNAKITRQIRALAMASRGQAWSWVSACSPDRVTRIGYRVLE
eukprot:1808927-Rhodomonas_salina.3